MSVIRGQCPRADERSSPLTQCREVATVTTRVDVGEHAELCDGGSPPDMVDVRESIGPKRRHDAVLAKSGAQRRMVLERGGRSVGRRNQFDAEPVEQCERSEVGLGQAGADQVVTLVGGLGRQSDVEVEQLGELMLEPVPTRGPAKEVPVCTQPTPDRASVPLVLAPVERRHAEVLQTDPLRHEHPSDVVVRHDEQRSRIDERRVAGEELGLDMSVHADQRQRGRLFVDAPCNRAHGFTGRQGAVGVWAKSHLCSSRSARPKAALKHPQTIAAISYCSYSGGRRDGAKCSDGSDPARSPRRACERVVMVATIRDVARLAGVSPSTVSRALSSPEIVKQSTVAVVRQAADRLGYLPNRTARGLITGRTGNLGVVIPDLGNPFFSAIVKGIQARGRAADYAAIVADSDEDGAAEVSLVRTLVKQVDGIIVCSPRMPEADLRSIADDTALVLVNRRVGEIACVAFDDAGGSRMAIEHLCALGHVKIAYAGGPTDSWSHRQRLHSIREATTDARIELVEFGPFTPRFESGLVAADLALASGATAVLAYNDLMAMGILRRLGERKIGVPSQISVVGNDDLLFASMSEPTLTTVALPTERAGRAAVDLLLSVLSTSDRAIELHRQLPATLLVRGSTGPCPR